MPAQPETDAPGYVTVAWDAVDAWFEEDEQVFGHPRNPYHRVDCLRSERRLRVEAAGATLVDTADTLVVYETALEPRLYVDPRLVRIELLRGVATQTYCPYKGTATYWTASRRRRPRRRRLELRGSASRVRAPAAPSELRRQRVHRPCTTSRRRTDASGGGQKRVASVARRRRQCLVWHVGASSWMNFETLLYEEDDGVAVVTLNRPEVHNAFDQRCRRNCASCGRPCAGTTTSGPSS